MNRFSVFALRILTLLGGALSFWLVTRHLRFVSGEALGEGLCSIARGMDCAAIESSRFSEIAGIPTASFGSFYFMVFAALAFSIRPGAPRGALAALAVLWGLLGLAACIALSLISAFVIRAGCPLCIVIYFITLACALFSVQDIGLSKIFSEALRGARVLTESLIALLDLKRPAPFPRPVILVAALMLFTFNFVTPASLLRTARSAAARSAAAPPEGPKLEELISDYFAAPIRTFDRSEISISRGDAAAPLDIVIFTDFECPFCGRFAPAFDQVLKKYEGRYRVTLKHFPFCSDCNPMIKEGTSPHPHACRLAEAAQALHALGKFWPVEADFYAIGSRDLNPAMHEVADKAGVAYADWIARMLAPDIRERIKRDIEEGLTLGMAELPVVFVNGRRLKTVDPVKIDRVLEAVLRRGPS